MERAEMPVNNQTVCRLLCLLLIAALLCGLCACTGPESPGQEEEVTSAPVNTAGGIPADAEGRLGWIRDKGVLRVATEPYFAPQEFIDSSQFGQDRFVGADMEMARLIADRMGVRLEIVPMAFAKVLTAVADGECDLAISALAYTPGRAETAELSKGYHFSADESGTGILIRTVDEERFASLDDLKGCRIAAQRGSIQESVFADHVFNYRSFRRLPTVRDLYTLLRSGQADAAAVDIETAQTYVAENPTSGLMLIPGLSFMPDSDYGGDRIAARKGEVQLIDYVNGIIDELLESGQYEQWFDYYTLYAKWLES